MLNDSECESSVCYKFQQDLSAFLKLSCHEIEAMDVFYYLIEAASKIACECAPSKIEAIDYMVQIAEDHIKEQTGWKENIDYLKKI